MNIDPEKLQITLNILKDIVTIFSTAFVAWVAWLGLQTWKRQLKGNTQYDLARRLAKATLNVGESVINLRKAGYIAGENDPENRRTFLDSRYILTRNAVTEFKSELLEAEVLWGNEVIIKTQPFIKNLGILQQSLIFYRLKFENPEYVQDYENAQNLLSIIFDMPSPTGESNQFTLEFQDSMKTILEFLKPYLTIDR